MDIVVVIAYGVMAATAVLCVFSSPVLFGASCHACERGRIVTQDEGDGTGAVGPTPRPAPPGGRCEGFPGRRKQERWRAPAAAPSLRVVEQVSVSRLLHDHRAPAATQARPRANQSSSVRSLSALVITETEEKLMAAAAIIGESSRPKNG